MPSDSGDRFSDGPGYIDIWRSEFQSQFEEASNNFFSRVALENARGIRSTVPMFDELSFFSHSEESLEGLQRDLVELQLAQAQRRRFLRSTLAGISYISPETPQAPDHRFTPLQTRDWSNLTNVPFIPTNLLQEAAEIQTRPIITIHDDDLEGTDKPSTHRNLAALLTYTP